LSAAPDADRSRTARGQLTPDIEAGIRGAGRVPEAGRSTTVDVPPDGSFDLRVHPVAKRIGGSVLRMLAYNASIPSPTLRVRQGSQIVVHVSNETEMQTTVHWQGLRLENQYDGVPHETQAPNGTGRPVHASSDLPRCGAVLLSPALARGLRAGDGSLRQRHR
jgi:hypothetical protein